MPTSDWAPTLLDVGAQLRSRTQDRSGNELGTFSDTTRPTGVQVQALIDQEASDLVDMLPPEVGMPQVLWGSAKQVALFGAAARVELSYFPEQINTGQSIYTQLKEWYDQKLAQLRKDLKALGYDVAPDGTGTTAPAEPVFSFPTEPIIGWKAGAW